MRARTAFVVVASSALLSCGATPRPPPSAAQTASRAPKPQAASAIPSFDARDVDLALRQEWSKAGIEPAPRVDDARWLRRVYIDVVGTIPAPAVVTAFVADTAPDKRAKMIDTLLASPQYAEHWMNYWDDELLGRDARGQDLDRGAFRRWLRTRFRDNAPWDTVVTELVSAVGVNSMGGARNAKNAGAWFPNDDEKDEPSVNGAVNWTVRYEQNPQDFAGSVSKTFLGVQIQCAQCHDHKTEKWKQTDFWSFATIFARTRVQRLDERPMMGQIRRVEVVDLDRPAPRFKKDPELAANLEAKPAALDGTPIAEGKGTRRALAMWMTSKDNPYFARATVNRIWGHFFGRGFADPVDDMRPSNPPVADALLQRMADDFAAHGYDMKRLIKTIAMTEAYQLAPGAPSKADPENKLWSHFRLTPMGPEELLNAILAATNVEGTVRRAAGGRNLAQLRFQLVRQYSFLFDVDEDADAPSYEGTVSQALALLNGNLVGIGSRDVPGSALAGILDAAGTDAEKIEKLYLRTLSRPPNAEELLDWKKYVEAPAGTGALAAPKPGDPLGKLGRRSLGAASDPKHAAYEDVFWALLNSSEFLFNH